MASLIDNLIQILDEETQQYKVLAGLSSEKTPVIIAGNIEKLQKIMDDEAEVASRLTNIDLRLTKAMEEIAGVLNTDVATLKLRDLIQVLERRPKEQQKLADAHDRLKEAVYEMKRVNDKNGILIKEALDLTKIQLDMIHSVQSAPQTANYTRTAATGGLTLGVTKGRFDAKQ